MSAQIEEAFSHEEATSYLKSLLNRPLRIHVTDGRMFVGNLKCTDKDRNIILASTHEYRLPSQRAIQQSAARAGEGESKVKVDMVKRFVGLVVVPGQYITKIETD